MKFLLISIIIWLTAWITNQLIKYNHEKKLQKAASKGLTFADLYLLLNYELKSLRVKADNVRKEEAKKDIIEFEVIPEEPRSFEWNVSNENRLGEVIAYTEIVEDENKTLS